MCAMQISALSPHSQRDLPLITQASTLAPSTSAMSQVPSTATSSTDFKTIFGAALEAYKTQTKKDIALHPLATQLQSCDSPSAILAVLRAQVQAFDKTHSADEKLTKWLDPTVNVLYAFAATLGNGVGLIFPPSNAIFVGIGILLQAVKDVRASQDALVDLFGRIEFFFKRLEAYIEVRPTAAMTDVIVKIMVEVLSILGILTKEIRQGRMKKFLKELVGKKDVKDALERLDKLTQEEAYMAAIEALKIGRSIDDKVQGIGHEVGSVIEGMKETGVAIQQMASQVGDLNRSGKRKDLQGWISPPDPSVNYNTACRAHHRGTAAWCTQGDTFVDWKASGSLLWIHGKPGSGKTILSSVIIRDIKSLSNARPGSAYMAYFFFDFKDTGKQGSRALLSSILVQLSNRSERCCDVLHELYSAHQNGAEQPTDNSLMQCLKDMLTIAEQVPIYLIMDALDECPNDSGMPSSRETVLELVEELVRLGRSNLRLCVTSRLEFDIRTALEPLAVHQVSLSDESGQKQDIIDYVTFVVCSDRRMKRWRDDDKDAVIETLTKKANGMFQWVFCHLEVLRHCFPNDVHRVLEELPESLDKTYERILKQIPKANRRHAYRLLQCIMTAIQPLRVEELAEVLALDFSTGAIPSLNTDWRWEDQEEAVLSACSSLVTVIVNNGSRVVQFSHFSVQEFLASDRLASSIDEVSHFHILLGPSHAMFVQACLGALVRLGDHADDRSVEQIPLVRYAARNWVLHAYFGSTELHIIDAMEYFLDRDKPHFKTWVTIQGPDITEMFSEVWSGRLAPAAPLYFAARSRFHGLVERLVVKYPQQVNACGGEHGTPLHVSVLMGNIDVARLLFAYGADINSCSADERTPLHIASKVGNLEVGRWLLNHGADVNPEDDDGSTPLHLAASNGHLEVSRMLLEHNAEVDALDSCGNTPFLNASISGNADIVQLCLDHSADAHVRDNRGNNALHLATTCSFATTFGRLEVVRILLPLHVEVNARNDIGSTPLLKASAQGSLDIVRLLLDHNADAGVRDNSGDTPLHNAACGGHLEVVQMLLERNVEVNAQNDEESTALLQALQSFKFQISPSQRPPKVAKLLLDHGADAHVRDNDGNTPLHIAASRGYLKVARILLECNVEVNTQDDSGSTPLLKASASGHHDIVQLLLDNGAGADVRDNNGNTALHLAAAGGVFGLDLNWMAKLFAPVAEPEANAHKYGGSVTIRRTSDSNSWREPQGSGGSPEVVRLLLDHGMDVQVRNDREKTASEVARGPRREQIVQLLSGNAMECEVECTSERPWAALDDVDPLRALAAMCGSRPF